MEIKYKPTKPKKEKPIKAPKAEKAAKPMSFGSAHSVKIDKPKKVKEPKPAKAPKPEKAVSFTPTKVEKAAEFKSSGKLPKSVNPKVLAIVLSAVAVVFCVAVIIFFNKTGFGEENPAKITGISIVHPPEKVEYYVGEEYSFYGLLVRVTFDSGINMTIGGADCEISGFNSSAPVEHQTITVKYAGYSATYQITILGDPVMETKPNITGLSFKNLPKTEYKVGEYMDISTGVLQIEYSDGSTEELELRYEYIYDFTTDAPGTYEVNVKLLKEGRLYTTTYTITVTE